MKDEREELHIPMQVGSELRIKNDGALSYRYDEKSRVHILRLLDPVADHRHVRVQRSGD